MLEFVKFSGDDNRTTLEHVEQFLLQCGEASYSDALKLRMFPLPLFGTAFTWFSSLAPNSIFSWAQLEQRFHEYFYTGDNELRLSHLTAIKQKFNEPVSDYIKRFRDTRNRCFNLTISDKDLADLAYAGLSSHIKDKLDNHGFADVSQVLLRALAMESRALDSRNFSKSNDTNKNDRPAVNILEYSSYESNNEEADVCVAKLNWNAKPKPFVCSVLKPVSQKNPQD